MIEFRAMLPIMRFVSVIILDRVEYIEYIDLLHLESELPVVSLLILH